MTATHSGQALDIIKAHVISMAILDVMMPDMDGFTLCKTIRKEYYFPILFLTAKEHENDKLEGLSCGGDDYMVKPFSSKELLARVASLIRRNTQYSQKQEMHQIKIANLIYNRSTGTFSVNGNLLDLTDIEYRILSFLVHQKGNSISTEDIYQHIWGDAFTVSSNNNVVVHIKNLRRKLSILDGETEYIHTVWGKGYAIYV